MVVLDRLNHETHEIHESFFAFFSKDSDHPQQGMTATSHPAAISFNSLASLRLCVSPAFVLFASFVGRNETMTTTNGTNSTNDRSVPEGVVAGNLKRSPFESLLH